MASPSIEQKLFDALRADEGLSAEPDSEIRRIVRTIEERLREYPPLLGDDPQNPTPPTDATIDSLLSRLADNIRADTLGSADEIFLEYAFAAQPATQEPPAPTERATPSGVFTLQDFEAGNIPEAEEEKTKKSFEARLAEYAQENLTNRLAAWVDDNKAVLVKRFQQSDIDDFDTWLSVAIVPDNVQHVQAVETSRELADDAFALSKKITTATNAGDLLQAQRLMGQQSDLFGQAITALSGSPFAVETLDPAAGIFEGGRLPSDPSVAAELQRLQRARSRVAMNEDILSQQLRTPSDIEPTRLNIESLEAGEPLDFQTEILATIEGRGLIPQDASQEFIDEVLRRVGAATEDFRKRQLVGAAPSVRVAIDQALGQLPSMEEFERRQEAAFTSTFGGGLPQGNVPALGPGASREEARAQLSGLAFGQPQQTRLGPVRSVLQAPGGEQLGQQTAATMRFSRVRGRLLGDDTMRFLENLAAGNQGAFSLAGDDLNPQRLLNEFLRDPERQAEKRSLQKAAFEAAQLAGREDAAQAALGFGVEQTFNPQEFQEFARQRVAERQKRFEELQRIAAGTPRQRTTRTVFRGAI